MRGVVFPVPTRREWNSGGVSERAEHVPSTVFERSQLLYVPIDYSSVCETKNKFPEFDIA